MKLLDPNLADELPVLALSRPAQALEQAQLLLGTHPPVRARVRALQTIGLARRELADVGHALTTLRQALRIAERDAGDAELAADVRASLGMTLAFAGRMQAALQELERAVDAASGVAAARIRVRLGFALQIAGRPGPAAKELAEAAHSLAAHRDAVWESRAQINLAQALIDLGRAARATEALERAEVLLDREQQTYETAIARHNRGLAAAVAGRIPEGLAHLRRAEEMYEDAGARPAELFFARCGMLLSAGLTHDALAAALDAREQVVASGASPAFRANAFVQVSDAAYACGQHDLAVDSAVEAGALYRRQRKDAARLHAAYLEIRARRARGDDPARLLRQARRVVDELGRVHTTRTATADLLVGQLFLDLGRLDDARQALDRAARARRRTSATALEQISGWHAAALASSVRPRRDAIYRRCERGLRLLREYQLTFGAVETRAAATRHGAAIVQLALEQAARDHDGAAMLLWSERWRSTSRRMPPVSLLPDAAAGEDLEALRRANLRRSEALMRDVAGYTPSSDQEIARLERRVRDRMLTQAGGDAAFDSAADDLDGLARVGSQLVELVRVGDDLHAVLVRDGTTSIVSTGSLRAALAAVQRARFLMRRVARPNRGDVDEAALVRTLHTLERGMLGDLAEHLDERPVVIAPPSVLHSVPWSALPGLEPRSVSIVDSLAEWLRSSAAPEPTGPTALIVGPHLNSDGREVERLTALYPDHVLVRGADATARNVLAALSDCGTAHIAAHGNFRPESPSFSSLTLVDGPLTMLDLATLRRAPRRLVLASCDIGDTTQLGWDESIGLLSTIGPLGTAGVVAPVLPILDDHAARFSERLHECLSGGQPMAEALRRVRAASQEQFVARVAAATFVAFGA